MTEQAPAPAAPEAPATVDMSGDRELAEVFGLDTSFLAAEEAPAAQAAEPAAGVVAPSPAAVPFPAASAAPTAAPVDPAPAPAPAPLADPNASPLPAPTVDPAAPAAPARTEAEQALYVRSLEAQVAALQQAPAPQPAPAATPQPDGTAPTDGEPQYALSIPQDVLGAVFGEDPAIAASGLTHLVNSLAKVIHKTVVAEMAPRIEAVRSTYVDTEASKARAEQAQQMRTQYYEKFPAHKNPTLLPIIQEQAQLLSVQYPNAPIDDNWYNALGSRVNATVQAITGVAPTLPAPTPAPAAPARPAAMLPTAAPRVDSLVPGQDGDDINTIENIAATFNGG